MLEVEQPGSSVLMHYNPIKYVSIVSRCFFLRLYLGAYGHWAAKPSWLLVCRHGANIPTNTHDSHIQDEVSWDL